MHYPVSSPYPAQVSSKGVPICLSGCLISAEGAPYTVDRTVLRFYGKAGKPQCLPVGTAMQLYTRNVVGKEYFYTEYFPSDYRAICGVGRLTIKKQSPQ